MGAQTDSLPVERRVVRRTTVLAPAKDRPAFAASLPIDIPVCVPVHKRPRPTVDDVWRSLHKQPPPGKRVTVHRPECGCFCCKRHRSSQVAHEGGQALAGSRPCVVVPPAHAVDVYDGRKAADAEQSAGGVA